MPSATESMNSSSSIGTSPLEASSLAASMALFTSRPGTSTPIMSRPPMVQESPSETLSLGSIERRSRSSAIIS